MFDIQDTVKDAIKKHWSFSATEQDKLIKTIERRFKYFVDNTQSFIVEEYVENEWRDSLDLYYSKTLYNCSNSVKRVHFINKKIEIIDDVASRDYIGYITIRPLPIPENAISRVRFKCTRYEFEECGNNKIFCLTMKTKVNLPHISISYDSFPIYVQDSMVAICAHADLLMISKFMYKKFNFNNYKLKDIILNNIATSKGRKIPSEGLTISEMVEILKQNNYNPILTYYPHGKHNDVSIIEHIDSFLESGLPVIIAFEFHVVVVIGHMHNEKKHYLIADDSTYHLSKTFHHAEAHVGIVSEEELMLTFSAIPNIFTIAPTFDRFYLHYPYLKLLLKKYFQNKVKNIYEQKKFEVNIITREILVESSKLKQFLYSCGDVSYADIVMPHYVWYVEFYLNSKKEENLSHYMIVDASSHKNDRVYSIIKDKASNGMHLASDKMSHKRQLSLLKEI